MFVGGVEELRVHDGLQQGSVSYEIRSIYSLCCFREIVAKVSE